MIFKDFSDVFGPFSAINNLTGVRSIKVLMVPLKVSRPLILCFRNAAKFQRTSEEHLKALVRAKRERSLEVDMKNVMFLVKYLLKETSNANSDMVIMACMQKHSKI